MSMRAMKWALSAPLWWLLEPRLDRAEFYTLEQAALGAEELQRELRRTIRHQQLRIEALERRLGMGRAGRDQVARMDAAIAAMREGAQ